MFRGCNPSAGQLGKNGDPMGLLDGGNAGRSSGIAPDPLSPTTPASLALVPIPLGSPVGSTTLLSVSCDDTDSQVLSCTLVNDFPFALPQNTDDGSIIARPVAIIEWGVGGVQATAEIDFLHGTTFTVEGSFLRVTGKNSRIPALFGQVPDNLIARNVVLGAFCGYGSTSKSNTFNAKKTFYIDQLKSDDTRVIKIPNYATNFLAYYNHDSIDTIVLAVMDEGGNVLQRSLWANNGQNNVPVELPGDAAFLLIETTSPMIDLPVRVVFGISL